MKRLRVFAGPNGSGKSTLKKILNEKLLGIYLNPDDIEKELKEGIDLSKFKITTNNIELSSYFDKNKNFYEVKNFKLDKNIFSVKTPNSYIASILTSFIRYKLIETNNSFSFESVMSGSDKIEFLKQAKNKGFKIYLYFIATYDPIINIKRVENRVKLGGHSVPEDKIVSRYYRSINNLVKIIPYTDRCYIFDNSNTSKVWLCEIEEAKKVEIKVDEIPEWFMDVLNKLKDKK
jgi:predicted ABC-type ATPase